MTQDPTQVLRTPFYFLLRLLTDKKSLEACLITVIMIAVIDWIFEAFVFSHYIQFLTTVLGMDRVVFENVDLGYVPVVWMIFLAFIIGTLVIVITFAAQNIPKLIDLYMEEWWSLFLIWFIIGGGIHMVVIKLFNEVEIYRDASVVLNIHLLSLTGMITFPYTFHVLKTTKTDNVINQLLRQNRTLVTQLARSRSRNVMQSHREIDRIQQVLFEILNQLADLLAYVPFKEPRANIIQGIGELLSYYVACKAHIAPRFFRITPGIQKDISFKTLKEQITDIEKAQTFYEQKGLRLIGETYLTFLETDQFDLSSLCAAQLGAIGTSAIQCKDHAMIELIMIRFNTHFRYALKHGQRYNEARNLFNLVFHYAQFIKVLVEAHSKEEVKTCFSYLRYYSEACYKAALDSPQLAFILDTIASDMVKLLMQIHQDNWELALQEALLDDFLLLDNPSGIERKDLTAFFSSKSRIRVVQIGLGLYYLKHHLEDFAMKVVNDTLQDLEMMEKSQFVKMMQGVFAQLRFQSDTFWEDGDRGNINIYYSPHADQIEKFEQIQMEQLEHKLTA